AAPPHPPAAPVVLADPDFDLPAEKPSRETGGQSAVGGLAAATRAAPRLGRVPRLPGTAREARAVAAALRAGGLAAPRLYLGKQAQKAVLAEVKGPQVLVLCTHGFFLSDARAKTGGGEESPDAGWENPWLRCGLLLAGCNQPARDGAPGREGL